MCGIGGIIKVTPAGEAAVAALAVPPQEAVPEAWLDVLDESIRHRGPDGQGRFRDRVVRADGSVVDVALVHRRLSIIDHGGGAQPMVSVVGGEAGHSARSAGPPKAGAFARGAMMPLLFHGKPDAAVVYEGMREVEAGGGAGDVHGQDARAADLVAVVFNGCIYNHRELRKELLAAGHEFRTDHSDTEVLLHGWREWGEGMFEKLDGMFALAIWDRLAAKLVMARDRCGEKPLYVSDEKNRELCAFASCGAATTRWASRAIGDVAHAIDPAAVGEWVRRGYGRSLAPNAVEIPPFTLAVWDGEWDWKEADLRPPSTVLEIDLLNGRFGQLCPPRIRSLNADEVDRILGHAVYSSLETDATLGCFLSGGIDSSLIARYARQMDSQLRTFTVRMPDARFDESRFGEQVASLIGTRHESLPCEANPAHDLVQLIHQLGLPFGDSSLLPAYWVSAAARRHVAVCLGGDGGDELFAGYERHRAARFVESTGSRVGALLRPVAALVRADANPRSRRTRASRFLNAMSHGGYDDLAAITPEPLLGQLGLRTPVLPFKYIRPMRFGSRAVDGALCRDMLNYLPGDLLRKTDTAGMSVALEVRSPMLRKSVVDAAVSAPIRCLMPRGQRKGLLRQVARKYFPAEIVDRPKQGFAIPIGEWFRSDYGGMKQLLMDHLESAEPWGPPRLGIELNMRFVRQMVDEHMNGRRDHSQRLYMLLVLSIWAKWMGGGL